MIDSLILYMEINEIKRKYCKINLLFLFVCLFVNIYEEAEKKGH